MGLSVRAKWLCYVRVSYRPLERENTSRVTSWRNEAVYKDGQGVTLELEAITAPVGLKEAGWTAQERWGPSQDLERWSTLTLFL